MDEMKKCTQCGTELPGDALFCPDCGARQSAAAPDAAAAPVGSTASYDPFEAQPTSSPEPSSPAQPPSQPAFQPAPPSAVQMPPPSFQQAPPPTYQQAPPSTFQPAPAYKPQPSAPSTQAPPPAAGFQYATPNQQQGVPNPYTPQPGMPGGAQQPYPAQQSPGMSPIVPLVKQGRKMPIYAIIVSAVLVIGLLYWFLNFFNADLPPYDFGETRSGAVVFAFILMSVVSVCNAVLLRVQLRGGKLAILADILLGILVLAMLYGISVTAFSDNNLFYKLFLNFTK